MHRMRQFWTQHANIRTRLTLWYLLSLVLILFMFTAFLLRQLDRALLEQADTALELAADRVLEHVGQEDGRLVFLRSGALGQIEREFDLYLIAPDGTLWDSLGDGDAPLLNSPKSGFVTISERGPGRDGAEWRVLSQPITSPDGATTGWLQIAQSPTGHRSVMKTFLKHLFCGLPLIFPLAGLGSFFLATRALRPISRITRTAQSITTSDLGERIDYQGPNDEVGQLATTFDRMLDRLQAGFERERRFSADAAHELRTPLTALKGGIGVTLSQPRQPPEYASALRDMEGQVDRLIRLSNDLLFMARLDHKEGEEQLDEIVLSDLFAALVDQVRPLAEAKSIVLLESAPPDLTIKGNMDLLIRLFLNLLDNAIKYTPLQGQVRIETEERADCVCVSVSDTGPGIPPEQLPHLFERFYRAESDRARRREPGAQAQGGAGLGLAIAQEIAQAHGGTLTVQSEPGEGCTFVFCIPRSP